MNGMRPSIAASVDRLLAQYREYSLLASSATEAKQEYEEKLLLLAKEYNVGLEEAMSSFVLRDEDLQRILMRKRTYERMRDRISDEMTFATPEIWMRYKALAYKETPDEIATWKDFQQHCLPAGYICSKRYAFLRDVAATVLNVSLDDFDETAPLLHACDASWVETLEQNEEVIERWQKHEFHATEHGVAKWENYA